MELELKPCPFCGGDADVCVYEIDLDGNTTYDAFQCYCTNCGIEHNEYRTKHDAIKGWNKRINMHDELIKSLHDMVEVVGSNFCQNMEIKRKYKIARELLERCK